MEIKHALVPLSDGLHLAIFLVTDTVVDIKELGDGHQAIERLRHVVSLVARQEGAIEVNALDEGVDGVAVSLYARHNNAAVLVTERGGLTHAGGTPRDSLVVDASGIIDSEGYVLDTITVLGVMCRELLMVWIQRRGECKRDIVVLNDMRAEFPLASLEALNSQNRMR